MNFSPQQEVALSVVGSWMRPTNSEQVLCLFGFAGTGKSTLAKHLVATSPGRWLYGAYTGKASHVMRQKGCDGASTIHSMIYRPNGVSRAEEMALLVTRVDQLERKKLRTPLEEKELVSRREQLRVARSESRPRFTLWADSPLSQPDVVGVVIDECSMIDQRLGEDLESFGKKILVLGDPAQLPPVGSGGHYTRRKPDVMLTDVHRHARESGILRLATDVRERRDIREWTSQPETDVLVRRRGDVDDLQSRVLAADQVLCGRNATRKSFNRRHRELLGRGSAACERGDRLVCLRNDRELGLYNGSQWVVLEADCDLGSRTADLVLQSEDSEAQVSCASWTHHMIGAESELTEMKDRRDLTEFDHSYCLTVHKSQGSQWNDVVLVDESAAFSRDGAEFARRWMYTGITRAARKLTMVLP